MLRAAVLGFGALLILGGGIGLACGAGVAMTGPLLFGALIIGSTVFEQRYHAPKTPPAGPAWERTAEVFKDPEKGDLVEVWYNKTTGERRYVTKKH